MIYCVIPRELVDDLYDQMVKHYEDNPNVTVIVDRREGPDRRQGEPPPGVKERRVTRDRRRARAPGTSLRPSRPSDRGARGGGLVRA